jgi:hypothetical protein
MAGFVEQVEYREGLRAAVVRGQHRPRGCNRSSAPVVLERHRLARKLSPHALDVTRNHRWPFDARREGGQRLSEIEHPEFQPGERHVEGLGNAAQALHAPAGQLAYGIGIGGLQSHRQDELRGAALSA